MQDTATHTDRERETDTHRHAYSNMHRHAQIFSHTHMHVHIHGIQTQQCKESPPTIFLVVVVLKFGADHVASRLM